jgi:hypothetical protein
VRQVFPGTDKDRLVAEAIFEEKGEGKSSMMSVESLSTGTGRGESEIGQVFG